MNTTATDILDLESILSGVDAALEAQSSETALAPPPDRRFSPEGNQNYDIKKVWDSHREIIRRIMLGQKNVDIAEALGCTPQTVSNVRNNPLVREQIALLQEMRDSEAVDLSRDIKALSPIALSVMKEVLKDAGAPWGVRIRAAMDTLDRAGYQPPKQVQVLHAHYTHDAIEEIKARARKIGIIRQEQEPIQEVSVEAA